jgi:preprotein translocase subunit SecB
VTGFPEELKRAAARLGGVAELKALVVRHLYWSVSEIPFDSTTTITPETNFNVAHGKAGSLLRYQVKTVVGGRIPAGQLFNLEVTHEAFFSVPEGDQTTDKEIDAFGAISVFFMVFPYIRETLQGLTVNAGLPPILLQPFRLPFDPASSVAVSKDETASQIPELGEAAPSSAP